MRSIATTFKLRLVLVLCAFSFLLVNCGPQHSLAFKQFGAQPEGTIMAVQGYVAAKPEDVESLKQKWNALAVEMQKMPGYVEGHLSLGVGESKLVLAHTTWRDLQSLRNAFANETIVALEDALPSQQFAHIFSHGSLNTYHKSTQAP